MRNVFTSVVIVFVVCICADAQTTSEHFMLERTAAVHGEVIVRDDGGGNIRGRLIEVGDEVLELETRSGRRRLDLSRVVRVAEPFDDPIIDGVFRGMGTATAWCVLTCERVENSHVRASAFAGHVALGGLIGGAIDRSINRGRTIHQRRPAHAVHIGVGRRGGSVTVLF